MKTHKNWLEGFISQGLHSSLCISHSKRKKLQWNPHSWRSANKCQTPAIIAFSKKWNQVRKSHLIRLKTNSILIIRSLIKQGITAWLNLKILENIQGNTLSQIVRQRVSISKKFEPNILKAKTHKGMAWASLDHTPSKIIGNSPSKSFKELPLASCSLRSMAPRAQLIRRGRHSTLRLRSHRLNKCGRQALALVRCLQTTRSTLCLTLLQQTSSTLTKSWWQTSNKR